MSELSRVQISKRFDNFDQVLLRQKQQLGQLVKRKAEEAVESMRNQAPRSKINVPGYIHFDEMFYASKGSESFNYGIFNDKVVNGYELWRLLEYGTRFMSPRKTIGPVMAIIGPEFLREAAEIVKGA